MIFFLFECDISLVAVTGPSTQLRDLDINHVERGSKIMCINIHLQAGSVASPSDSATLTLSFTVPSPIFHDLHSKATKNGKVTELCLR